MISGYWTVPTAPTNVGGQTIYFFNAITGVYNQQSFIIQPVLAFGATQCGLNSVGGNYWYLASFLVFHTGACYVTSLINPNVSDQIFGEVLWLSSGCSGGTTGYEIIADDLSLNTAVDLYFCKSNMDPSVDSAVLEAKNLNSCDQFPNQQMGVPSLDFTSISSTPSTLSWTYSAPPQVPQCGYAVVSMNQVHIHSYPTTDHYSRSHGLSLDQTLPVPRWPPYQSGYVIATTGSAFDYSTNYVFNPFTNHYVQEAASGFVPNNAWHTQIYINGALNTEGDVGRNQILQANFYAGLTPNVRLDF
jgi:hypothetical protein